MPGFSVIFFPEDEYDKNCFPGTSLGKRFSQLLEEHEKEFRLLTTVIDVIQNPDTGHKAFTDYSKNKIICKLPEGCDKESIWEIRTPKTRRKGVLRTYFCIARKSDHTIVLLDAEFKRKKKAKLTIACKRQTEYRNNYDK